MRGGDSRVEFYCGFTCVSMYALYSHAVWNAGANLSFKLIERYYCDYFYQNANTRYVIRGGFSNNGYPSGTFCTHMAVSYGDSRFHMGASLSFKTIVIIFIKVHQVIILYVVVEQGMVTKVVFLLLI